MYERSGKHRSEDRSLVPAVRMECEDPVTVVSDGEKSVSTRQASTLDLELDADWDPVLPTVCRLQWKVRKLTFQSCIVENMSAPNYLTCSPNYTKPMKKSLILVTKMSVQVGRTSIAYYARTFD